MPSQCHLGIHEFIWAISRQVEVEQTDLAPVGMDQSDSRQLVRAKQLVWKTVPLLDERGNLQRAENPLAQYGIDVTQATLILILTVSRT